jgi:hypothetical protein
VSGPGAGDNSREYEGPRDNGRLIPPETNPFYAFFLRVKLVFIAAVLLVSFGLIILGVILTSTLIGAVVGIPLILLGIFPLWFLPKLLVSGKKNNFFVFRRF